MTIKKTVQPKCRLPVLNWVAMKPNQVKGTVFSELDDEKLYTVSTYRFSSGVMYVSSSSLESPPPTPGGHVIDCLWGREEVVL